MSYTKEQLEKLPKWAQSEIKRLKGLTESLDKKLSEFNGVSETNTYLKEGIYLKPLTNNARIKFEVGKNKLNAVEVYINRENGVIEVDGGMSENKMVLVPMAANSFQIIFSERFPFYAAEL
jgi:hypothetical protein